MKKLALIVCLVSIKVCLGQAPGWQWAKHISSDNDDYAWVANDPSGNTIVGGWFFGSYVVIDTASFGNANSFSSADAFLAKYNSAGKLLWAQTIATTNDEEITAVKTDTSGNIYIAGFFSGTGITIGTTPLSGPGIFLVKLDPQGNVLWAKRAGASNDVVNSIAVDESGNVYMTGSFYGSITFGSTTFISNGGKDIYLAKYDTNGNILWAKNGAGYNLDDEAKAVETDHLGNVYIAGHFNSSVINFGSAHLYASTGKAFIVKYDGNGNIVWARNPVCNNDAVANALASDAAGNIYMGGWFSSNTITFGSHVLTNSTTNGYHDIFLVKYDRRDTVVWVSGASGNSYEEICAIVTDTSKNVYVAGDFGTTPFKIGSTLLTSKGNSDIFTAKFDSTGHFVWANSVGGTSGEYPQNISSDISGNLFMSANYNSNPIIVGPDTLGNLGFSDVFVAKIPRCGFAIADAGSDTSVCYNNSVTLHGWSTGTYSWSPASGLSNPSIANPVATPSVTTKYFLQAADNCGLGIDSLTITVNPLPSVTVNSTTLCTSSSATICASGASTYSWSPSYAISSTTGACVTASPTITTNYTVTGTDVNGCMNAAVSNVALDQCVWPGDADENLTVDNYDLLPIGVKYGLSGSARSSVSNSWQGFPCNAWNDTLSNGRNTKYADCDGNGTIDMNDTLAVNLNYGLSHVTRNSAPGHMQITNKDIFILFDKTQYIAGDTLNATIYIGKSSFPQTAFYGAAFSLSYDPSVVQAGTEKFWFNNSWVGNIDQSMIKFSKLNSGIGMVNASLVRITHTDTSGYGKVAVLQYVLRSGLSDQTLSFTISNAVKTNSSGINTALNTGIDSVSLVNSTTGISLQGNSIKIYPNPARETLVIESLTSSEIVFTDMIGNEMKRIPMRKQREQIDISAFPRGVYIIQSGQYRARFVKE